MNIALCAKRFINNDIQFNLNVFLDTIEQLPSHIDLICFGEGFLQGFDCLTFNYDNDKNIAIDINSTYIRQIREKSRQKNVAVAFGYMELCDESIYSSYLVCSKLGEIILNYRRVSPRWRIPSADYHYKEGKDFYTFTINDISISMALCGDLYYDEIVEAVSKKNADVTLWPIYVDFTEDRWNNEERYEYEKQAAKINKKVLLVNSVCDGADYAKGAAAYFVNGKIQADTLPGTESILVVN